MESAGRDFHRSNSSSGSGSRDSESPQSLTQTILNQLNNFLNGLKQLFSKVIAQVILFYTQLTDQQKTYIGVALLGVLFYFLFFAGSASGGGFLGGLGGRNRFSGRPYNGMPGSEARTNTFRTASRGAKSYNDEYPRYDETDSNRYDNRESDRVHRSGNRYNENYDRGRQNYGSDTSYGLSWPLWGAIIAGAYKLPPYFQAQLGPEYARPFFGMTFMSFTMLLNMLTNSMRGRGRGMGLFGSAFNRRRF